MLQRICPLVLFLVLFVSPVSAFKIPEILIDPEDGALDAGRFLLEYDGAFLPVPIFITEPAIGYGGGAALVFFHPKGEPDATTGEAELFDGEYRPAITAGFGFYTGSDSWMLGAAHINHFMEDRLRYEGVLAAYRFNLTFYTDSLMNTFGQDVGLGYGIEGGVIYQELKYRIGESHWYVGGQYFGFGAKTDFTVAGENIPSDVDLFNSGLGVVASYDTRDNTFSASDGSLIDLSALSYNRAFGGNFAYESYQADLKHWWGIDGFGSIAVRLNVENAVGDVPFFSLPFIHLRGIPLQRYQANVAASFETEARWDVTRRWSLVGFGGMGRVADNFGELGSATSRFTGGGGMRYLLARQFGMRGGFDVARGPEQWVFYLTVGSAW